MTVRELLPENPTLEMVEAAVTLDRMLEEPPNASEQLRISDPERYARFVGGASVWSFVDWLSTANDEAPAWGTKARGEYLDDLWQKEPKLAGVIYSMESRVAVMGWTITGPVDNLKKIWAIFGEAETSHDFGNLVRPVFRAYSVFDEGGVIEIAPNALGVPKLYYLPTRRCYPGPVIWQNEVWDLLFLDVDGQWKGMKGDQFWRYCSMPDEDPFRREIGHSFMSRACRAAKNAIKLTEYEEEKLNNLPPEGIATVTGLTKTQVEQAKRLYNEERKRHSSLTFPGVLWLVANTFGQEVTVDFISFRDVWEGFNAKEAAEIYMKTLSLDAGVDVAEFWLIDITGATKAAAERQHRKALGKGPAEFLVAFERFANRLIPDDYAWQFDVVDDEQDLMVQNVRAARIKNIMDLWRPDPVKMEGLLSTEQAQQLLVEEKVVPRRFFETEFGMVTDVMRESGQTIATMDREGNLYVHRRWWTGWSAVDDKVH